MAVALALGLGACKGPQVPDGPLVLTGKTMGTTYHIKVVAPDMPDEAADYLRSKIDEILVRINKQMSTYDPESELSRFNRHEADKAFPVSLATADVVAAAVRLSKSTGGAFDPTVGPLVDLWGFGPEGRRTQPPSDAEIKAALARIGAEHIRVSPSPPTLLKKVPGIRLDLGAIAKGYGVDVVAGFLRKEGFKDFMVEIGGEVYAEGRSPFGRSWRIGIDLPVDRSAPGEALSGVVRLRDRGMATSGNYRNFFKADGSRYSHIIDPRTGRPVDHTLASATVVARTCTRADGAATAVMVLGPEKGIEWLNARGLRALLLVAREDGTYQEINTLGMGVRPRPATKP